MKNLKISIRIYSSDDDYLYDIIEADNYKDALIILCDSVNAYSSGIKLHRRVFENDN